MGISERKEREKNLKRQAILCAAIKLFKEKGFMNVTVQDIADFAEISPGSIYLQYKSKDDIYAAIADLGNSKADEKLEKLLRPDKPLTFERVKEFIRDFLEIYAEYGVYFDVLLLSYKGKKTFPELSDDIIQKLKDGALKSLMRIVNYFVEVQGEKDVETLKCRLLLCWAMLLGTAQLVDVGGRKQMLSEPEVETVLDQCALSVMQNLLKTESRS